MTSENYKQKCDELGLKREEEFGEFIDVNLGKFIEPLIEDKARKESEDNEEEEDEEKRA